LRPIYGISAIQRCLIQTLAIKYSQTSVLATTTNREDDILLEHTIERRVDFVRGAELDVLERFLMAVHHHDADIVIRVTGDCPIVSYEMADLVVESHLATDADVSCFQSGFAVGTNCEVYNVGALNRLRALLPRTLHSEYLILYFINNPGIFRTNIVELPEFFRREWRLTLDEQSDLDLFEWIFSSLRVGARAISFQEIVDFFTAHPEAASINSSSKLRYVHDQNFVTYLNQVTKIRNP